MDRELNILVIDDELCRPERLSTLKAAYGELESREPPFVFHYETAEENRNKYGVGPALRRIELIPDLDVVVLDVMFGDQANRLGLDILEAVRQEHPLLPVIIMTSLEGEIEVVEKAMELGANEYLIKMPTLTELEETLRSYALPPTSEGRFAIWGNCSAIRHTRALIARVSAAGGLSVLVTGESGTGKELAARAIHRQGPRRGGRFVAKNCAFADLQLLDSDLFGHEKGAFTGADRQHVGRIERADKGVLFLDEIGSIVPALQGKLLRVLE
ncbi:MAG: response regulator, partial [Nitrospiraceae bacterium]|nr:response regulator [Nitrospiraceae bacterium]